MRISKLNFLSPTRNLDFNQEARGLVGEIFQTEHEGGLGYLQSRSSVRTAEERGDAPFDVDYIHDEVPPESYRLSKDALEGCGPHERVLLSCLAWGSYRTYVMTGDMGSGKSATVRFITERLGRPAPGVCDRCPACSPIVLVMNFNEGFNERSVDAVTAEFHRRLYEKMRRALKTLLTQRELLLGAMIGAAGRNDPTVPDAFEHFVSLRQGDGAWHALPLHEKVLSLFTYIEAATDGSFARVHHVMELLRWIKVSARLHDGCFVVIYDNIDSVLAEAQYDILFDMLALGEGAGGRALVVLRRSTFHRLAPQAAYSFGPLNHAGPGPSEVIAGRLEHFVSTGTAAPMKAAVSEAVFDAIVKRARYLLATRRDALGTLPRVGNLSGASVRLGLCMAERLFLNNVVPYDQDPAHKDDAFRAVLVAESKTGGMDERDRSIANLFRDPETGELSLLPLRVLQLLEHAKADKNRRVVSYLCALLRIGGEWREEKVRQGLNYLLHGRRPLVWADGRSAYDRVEDMQLDVLHLTEAGETYLKYLIRDLVYVEEACMGIDWPQRPEEPEPLPVRVDIEAMVDRFKLLRAFLRELCGRDWKETARLYEWAAGDGRRGELKLALISSRILAALGNAVLRIMAEVGPERVDVAALRRDWLSLANMALARGDEVEDVCKRLERVRNEYRSVVGGIE